MLIIRTNGIKQTVLKSVIAAMKTGIVFLNARIVDITTDLYGSLIAQDGIISDFGSHLNAENIELKNFHVIDCDGRVLMPGIIDIQVHFREPGQEHKETIATGLASAAAGGVTAVVCQPNTSPTIDNTDVLRFVLSKERRSLPLDLYCYASVTKGLNGKEITDMRALVEGGAVGFTDDGNPVSSPTIMEQALRQCAVLKVPLAQHAEDLVISAEGSVNRGYVSEILSDIGIPNSSEYLVVRRDLDILRKLNNNAHYHVLHISTKEAIDAVRIAKKQGLNVTCEATPHHFTLNEGAVLEFGAMAKMNPPLRSEQDRMAILEGLADNTIDCIATDHAPHDIKSKNCPLSQAAFGIVGLETLFSLSIQLYHSGLLPLQSLIGKLTSQPAQIINKRAGAIKKGHPANLTLVDPEREYVIDAQSFRSKSKNTPFDNMKIKGQVLMTIAAGQVVYDKNCKASFNL